LTELGVDFIARQVPVERSERTRLVHAAGADTIPVLILDEGDAVVGEAEIGEYLARRFEEPPTAAAHRLKAEKMAARGTQTAQTPRRGPGRARARLTQ
jgi:glutathione S-transferase